MVTGGVPFEFEDVEEARLAMSGNLCRCGAYDHYLKAVMRAAREA